MKDFNYKVIGLMSGTSLDGLDIALCSFRKKGSKWSYKIESAATIPYNNALQLRLQNAHLVSGQSLTELDSAYGAFIGAEIAKFVKKNKIRKVDLISSHGHTVFHQPENKFTLQIGNGAAIAAATGVKTVCDFRSTDVALGGQGAPLVPIGDELLFKEYDACLNIGGIANISFNRNKKRIAFDIAPVNMVLNYLAKQVDLNYDKGGEIAAGGKFNEELLNRFNGFDFYKNYKSKSLGREHVEQHFISTLERSSLSVPDKLATVSEHAAFQIARVLNHFKIKNVLITGGGAYNTDLLNRISAYSNCELHVPDDKTIQFKEALIFAFLGVLRVRGEVNVLRQVTGAKKDSSSGAVYG